MGNCYGPSIVPYLPVLEPLGWPSPLQTQANARTDMKVSERDSSWILPLQTSPTAEAQQSQSLRAMHVESQQYLSLMWLPTFLGVLEKRLANSGLA